MFLCLILICLPNLFYVAGIENYSHVGKIKCALSQKRKKNLIMNSQFIIFCSQMMHQNLFFMRAHTEPEGTWVNEENWQSSRYPLSLTGISGLIKPGKAKQVWLC